MNSVTSCPIRIITTLLVGVTFVWPTRAQESGLTPGLQNNQPAEGRFCKTDRGFMVPYNETIPGSELTFTMVPIPGGEFQLGSPHSEPDRQDDEGPQTKVQIEPFWMAQFEVTWAEYKYFMQLYDVLKAQPAEQRAAHGQADAGTFTVPTPLYEPSFTYMLGEEPRQPAVSMTQYGAKQYTKWLTATTGRFHRLPSEAEWEYASRAGTTTPFSFGQDVEQLSEHAWFYDNSEDTYHEVGKKKPNPWDLYDMQGNVGEMVLDHYAQDGYASLTKVAGTMVHLGESSVFGRVVRGGAWDQEPAELRSAARDKTDDWRVEDPNFPKSPWWFTDEESLTVGFRVIRPLNEPPRKDRGVFFDADVELTRLDVQNRMDEGRGVAGASDPRAKP